MERALRGPVAQAILRRRSVRAFRPDQIPRDVVEQLLKIACRAPSGGNLQPWRVHVVVGAAKAGLEARIARRLAAGDTGGESEFAVYPAGLWEPHRTFRREAGSQRFARLGLPDRDPAARLEMLRRNLRFFGAPVGLFVTLDRRMRSSQWVDVGLFAQSLMLVADEFGLGTCAQAIWTDWSREVALTIGDEGQLLFGMALGYPDPADPLAAVPTTRRSVESFVNFHE